MDIASPARHGRWLLLLLALPVIELSLQFRVDAAVVTTEQWAEAAELVRDEFRPGDVILAAPDWAEPLVREQLGDLVDVYTATPHDLAPFQRAWVVSIRDAEHRFEDGLVLADEREQGGVRVRRYDLGPSLVKYDLARNIHEASVSFSGGECSWQRRRHVNKSGLWTGSYVPKEHFICDPNRGWLWVGSSGTEDGALRPHACIWQHPEGEVPVVTSFSDLPLGDRVEISGTHFYEHERAEDKGTTMVEVFVDNRSVGVARFGDMEEFKQVEFDTGAAPGTRGEVRLEISTDAAFHRSFCWRASTREGQR